MQEEATHFMAQLAGPEFAEAVAAFREKRSPQFG
jgi:enoyl-CoA hydratase/carnithine racemase